MRLLILDKDGTLVCPISDPAGFVQSHDDQQLLPGVLPALDRWRAAGWLPVIASNQGGVAMGSKTLDGAIAEMRFAMQLTGIEISFFCPDFQGQDCWMVEPKAPAITVDRFAGTYRKPGAGMLKSAILMMPWDAADDTGACPPAAAPDYPQLRPGRVLMVGDRPEDAEAAANAGIPFLGHVEWRTTEPALHAFDFWTGRT